MEGARFVVISYHSLEDRIVKKYFRDLAADCVCPPDFPVCRCDKRSEALILTPRPVSAGRIEPSGTRAPAARDCAPSNAARPRRRQPEGELNATFEYQKIENRTRRRDNFLLRYLPILLVLAAGIVVGKIYLQSVAIRWSRELIERNEAARDIELRTRS